jgi:putative FmdB family regulatory protein
MPTYDYHCEKCDKTFEVFQSMTARRLTKCPDEKCKGKVKRLLGTGAGLIFKGSGFYETDYRSDAYKTAAKNDSGKSETKSPAKEETKKPAKKEKAADKKAT